MKSLFFVLTLLCGCFVYAQDFLPATDDIPLMAGLYQVEETATFDSPSEKMAIVFAVSKEKPEQITRYYRQVLTNLGWTEQKNNRYVRGSDTLTLEITTDKETSVQFTLVQKN